MDHIKTYQPLLFSIAYRMTGYASQAEDIVQEAYLRYHQADQAAIQSPKSYLTAIVTNLSLNYLKSAQREREEYVGIWLPEPILTSLPKGESPEELYEQHESIALAFLVLLERLSPPERAVSSCMRCLTTPSRKLPRSSRKPRSIAASSFIARKAMSPKNGTVSLSSPPISAS